MKAGNVEDGLLMSEIYLVAVIPRPRGEASGTPSDEEVVNVDVNVIGRVEDSAKMGHRNHGLSMKWMMRSKHRS